MNQLNNEFIIYSISIGVFTILSAFFSGIETTVVSSSKLKIDNLAGKGDRKALRAKSVLEDIDSVIGMVLIGNNIANITATALITYVLTKTFLVNENELFIFTAIQTIIFLIFCEIFPKLLSKAKPESILLFLSLPIQFLTIIFKPFIYLSLKISDGIRDFVGIKNKDIKIISSRDDIATYFSIGKKEGLIDEERQVYISEILSFKNNQASEIMTPLVDIISISAKSDLKKLTLLIEKTGFSRIPVFKDKTENIIGYIHYRDLLKKSDIKDLADIVKQPVFIPSTKNVFELYNEMHKNKTPLLFVVNEYGDIIGLLTFEDIAEEIVGEIQTDDHPDENLITKISERKYDLSGRLDIDYFQRFFSIKIDKKNFETIGGFITYLFGKIPEVNEKVKYKDYEFQVTESGNRSVDRAMFYLPSKTKKNKKNKSV